MDKRILDEKVALLSTDYVPKYEQIYIHPEEGESFRFNDTIDDISDDMKFLDNFIIDKANSLDNLVNSTVSRLAQINFKILSEQERLQDIKLLCNKFTDFDNVIPINTEDKVFGNFTFQDGTFSALVSNRSKITLNVLDITGNGIEGNKYVYNDYSFAKDSMDTSIRGNLVDNSLTSYWEYERITASPKEDFLLSDFNIDSEDAVCTITMYSNKKINLLDLNSDNNNIEIIGIQYSDDGVDYTPLEIPIIKLNDKLASYEEYDYIYGDNKILIPRSQYVKITFQSSGVTDDTIAYDRVMFEKYREKTEEEWAAEDAVDGIIGGQIGAGVQDVYTEYNKLIDETVIVDTARRHNIKLNDISGYEALYHNNSWFSTDELITDGKYYSAAVFANVYLPVDMKNENIQFVLTINGEDYECIPINNKGNGLKVFRFSQGKSNNEYTQLLKSPIVSLKLTVKISGAKYISPYVNNIKILLGGEI